MARLYADSVTDRVIQVPGLVLIGVRDRRVPWRAALAWAAACRKAGKQVDLVGY
jgi:hypothetical protein